MEALQELRDLADTPVRVASGYRCPDHNRCRWRRETESAPAADTPRTS
ncbi:MAG: D-Ala-D-Ala carboxypeptidase family metallohydrolase [Desulfobacterales bacterium]|nr:D-Ala-D-Ala carboxypeptidase family metallohydrolase [Desulfobacterales bacterium]